MKPEEQEPGTNPRPLQWPSASEAFGLGLRRPHFDEIFENHRGVDFLEIISENFMDFGGRTREVLERVVRAFPIVVHGVSMSVGGPDPLKEEYLERLKRFIEFVKTPWFSDHLCYTSAFGVEYHDLMQLPFTEEAVGHVVERIKQIQGKIGIPFLVENISYYAVMPGEMTEAEFTREIVSRADCGLLLDVNNVFVNGTNHGYDPCAFIDAMPADRVLQYHIGGHDPSGPFIVDTHSTPVRKEVLDLYAYTCRKIGPAWTLLEWDNDIPDLDVLLAENEKVRAAALRALPDSRGAEGQGAA
jgi:uncharacterized protein (UPF0276 family)